MIGEEEERDTVMRTMTGVTGGCYRGDFCGAIAGATMAIGCLFGRANLDEIEGSGEIWRYQLSDYLPL
jgi:hypothetical protein